MGAIRNWLQRRAERKKLDGLHALLDRPHDALDIARLFPVILPSGPRCEDWVGPTLPIGTLPFAIGWAIIEPPRWRYVDHAMAAHFDENRPEWRRTAFANLRRESELPANLQKCDDDGQPFIRIMLQDDGFGPSRLLIPHLFDEELGADYEIAIPERTCAVAYRVNLTDAQRGDVAGMIDGCFRHGTEPVSNQRFAPAGFWEPAIDNRW